MRCNDQRYRALERAGCGITDEEARKGWHFCDEWDGMLLHPSMEAEWESCACFTPETKARYESLYWG